MIAVVAGAVIVALVLWFVRHRRQAAKSAK
jgi:hypothetical protein